MDTSLRYEVDREEPDINTLLDFGDSQGILRLAENCNGSGDCRKPHTAKGTMCPSYHATRNEKDTTRARANVLREVLTESGSLQGFQSSDLKEVMNLCLSCKACASECPSNVDIATAKAEFLYQYQKVHGTSRADRLFAKSTSLNRKMSRFPRFMNLINNGWLTSGLVKRMAGVAAARQIPKLSQTTFQAYYERHSGNEVHSNRKVVLFVDEFSNYLDADIAIDCFELLVALGYSVTAVSHLDSGRALISKGFLKEAKEQATRNVAELSNMISSECPLLGIEPSAVLSFRDEYIRLVEDVASAKKIAGNAFLIEEFLASEMEKGYIHADQFTSEAKTLKIHVHCHQKALSNQKVTFDILNLPENYSPTLIPSGCCGMAGSFGYEKEHYGLSMDIGNLTLFPAVRKASDEVIIVANGTSCRHQITDGTKRHAKHPVSVLRAALLNSR